MKILMVINGLHRGGRERRFLELIKGLTKEPGKFDIYIISLSPIVEYPIVYDLPVKFQIMAGKDKKKINRLIKMRRIIRSFKPDIIHSWDITCSGYLGISNLLLNKPVIQGVIYDASSQSPLGQSIRNRIRLLSPFSKAFVSNSQAGIRAYQPPVEKSLVIYNGIDLLRFNNLKDRETVETEILGGPKGNRFVVAMVAAFQERKDYNTFLEAAIKLCRKDPNMTFLLIGAGENLPVIKEKTPGDLLDKQIFFPGMRQDIESILQFVDIGVLMTNSTNHSEGISNTIVEYMAGGKPVIATKGGGTDELVRDGKNGFLINPLDSSILISKIETLRNDPSLAAQMGQKGRQWITDNFEIKRMTEEYINLYEKVLNKESVVLENKIMN
ncbi:MAG: glycosyltransferase family 4 protein [Chitinophagaceae bacterium]